MDKIKNKLQPTYARHSRTSTMSSSLSDGLLSVAMESEKEVFAASAVELPTVSTLWTKFVTKTLKSVNKAPITVAQLHGMMMKHCVTDELVTTPVHSELGMLGSVVLAPATGGLILP